ncbi:integrase catalytic domain-containing protein [Trichonephila clavipes]|nr:integrase catalytic domain-containing protein [Trichonephila clavipes]
MNLRSSSQLMGDLPPIRFQQIRPFESTGLDFAGPLTTKCAHKRSASSHLRKLVDLCLQEEVQNFLSLKGIEWSFIPPYTPHFGGLWESAIKSAKQLLIKATNSVLLNFEECSTLLIQIEACLNSRPLTELSPDPSDFTALTPAHFLVGGPIHQFPEASQPSRSVPLSERWNLIQRLRQYFWDRWSTEYLHRLQPRSKWWRTKPNLQLGDMVIVEKEKTAPLNWTLGRINKLFFGPDQKVKEIARDTYTEFFSGEYNLDRLDGFKLEFCNATDMEKMFKIYSKLHDTLWQYMEEVRINPLRSREQMQSHEAKICGSPFVGKCIEFGNKCG